MIRVPRPRDVRKIPTQGLFKTWDPTDHWPDPRAPGIFEKSRSQVF
jgi:hypothetical protein